MFFLSPKHTQGGGEREREEKREPYTQEVMEELTPDFKLFWGGHVF